MTVNDSFNFMNKIFGYNTPLVADQDGSLYAIIDKHNSPASYATKLLSKHANNLLEATSELQENEVLKHIQQRCNSESIRRISEFFFKEYPERVSSAHEKEKIIQKGIKCLEIATADKTNALALYTLAIFYDKGENVKQSKEKAFELYQLAAEQGHKEAQDALKARKTIE